MRAVTINYEFSLPRLANLKAAKITLWSVGVSVSVNMALKCCGCHMICQKIHDCVLYNNYYNYTTSLIPVTSMTAAVRATFTGFDPCKLTGVRVTGRELGHGSYATVLELEYMGLKCAGKKIHELLLRQGDTSYTVRRFEEECHLLSQVRHPNIVQFLGVYFQWRVQVPILVMEFLPTNLTSCIEQYDILPKEISYSILHHVALGLCYLHSQTPPIIHRDLSSNNVLITSNMTAKISDLGVARILNLTPLQVSRMTQTPGTPAYMPPEVMVADPKYDNSVDEFSYGIMMIHVFSGRWPEPQVGPSRTEPDGRLIPVTEAERRELFLRAIGNDHPLMDLILKCIHNHPQARAPASEIVERLADMVLQFPASYANQLEMLRQTEADREEKRALTEEGERKDRIIQEKESQNLALRGEVQAEREIKNTEIHQLKLVHSSEIEQLQLQIGDLNAQSQLARAKMEAELVELKSHAILFQCKIDNNFKALIQERDQSKLQLAQERETIQKLMSDIQDLQSDLSKVRSENITLQNTILELQADIVEKGSIIQMKEASAKRKDSEIAANSKALQVKDTTISAMSNQLTKVREYLATKQQVSEWLL